MITRSNAHTRKKKKLIKSIDTTYFIRIIVMSAVILLAFVWLCGFMIEDVLPDIVTLIAGILCLALLFLYCLFSIGEARKEERLFKQAVADRKARCAEMEAEGFAPTFKSLGSSRMFAVDENAGKWCVIDYFNQPREAKLHELSSIRKIGKATNAEYVAPDRTILMFNGRKLSKKDAAEYYSKEGIVIKLDEPDCPYEFVNCFKTENDADIILNYLRNLLDKRQAM